MEPNSEILEPDFSKMISEATPSSAEAKKARKRENNRGAARRPRLLQKERFEKILSENEELKGEVKELKSKNEKLTEAVRRLEIMRWLM
jgi:predicted RNase H-like nuclease (RuvC/YqgF family)